MLYIVSQPTNTDPKRQGLGKLTYLGALPRLTVVYYGPVEGGRNGRESFELTSNSSSPSIYLKLEPLLLAPCSEDAGHACRSCRPCMHVTSTTESAVRSRPRLCQHPNGEDMLRNSESPDPVEALLVGAAPHDLTTRSRSRSPKKKAPEIEPWP